MADRGAIDTAIGCRTGFSSRRGLSYGRQVQEAAAELGDFTSSAGFFVGDGIGAFEIRKQGGFGVCGEIVYVNPADVVIAGIIDAACKGFLDAAARSVDGGRAEDERRPGSGGDALLGCDTGTGALGLRIDRSGGIDVRRGSVNGGGGEIHDSRGGGSERVEQVSGFGGWHGMEHQNAGVQVRGEIVERDDAGAELPE